MVAALEHPAGTHVNSIFVFKTGGVPGYLTQVYIPGGILAGDSAGAVKTWDVRRQTVIHEFRASNLAVSHVHCSDPSQGDKEGRFISVNSYDDVLRVYRRGISLHHDSLSVPQCDLVHAVEGHSVRHYPVKSAFYEGPDYQIGSTWSVKQRVANGDHEMLEDHDHSPIHEFERAGQQVFYGLTS